MTHTPRASFNIWRKCPAPRISSLSPKTQQQQFAEMLELVSAYAAGGEEAVKATGGQTATLLLEHLKQQPMPILEDEREPVRVSHKPISPPKQNR